MTYFHAIILSIVEGITEFLPISSTGHLILTSHLLKISETEFVKSFEIIIQLSAILAIVILYWKTLLTNLEAWKRIIVAFIPTAVIGFTFYKLIKHFLLGNSNIVLISLFVGGIFLIILEGIYKQRKENTIDKIEKLKIKDAFYIGLFQSISIVPGVSRSAASIFGGLSVGLKREKAVEFSFLLAVPTMIAASSLDILKSGATFSGQEIKLLLVGFLGSFIIALFAVKIFLGYIKKHNFIPFGIYRILIAVLFWIIMVR